MFRHWWLKYGCFRYGFLGGTGVGGDERFGVLNVFGIRVGGDVAIGG